MKEYRLKPHQKELANHLLNINQKNLYYLVSQPDERYNNHTINELKKHIYSAIKKYTKEYYIYDYRPGMENNLFEYFLFIEYPKQFYLGLQDENTDLTNLYMAPHFHLFISGKKGFVCIERVIHSIYEELTSQKLKRLSLKKYDYVKLNNIPIPFAEYHTKQHYQYVDKNRLLTNIKRIKQN